MDEPSAAISASEGIGHVTAKLKWQLAGKQQPQNFRKHTEVGNADVRLLRNFSATAWHNR